MGSCPALEELRSNPFRCLLGLHGLHVFNGSWSIKHCLTNQSDECSMNKCDSLILIMFNESEISDAIFAYVQNDVKSIMNISVISQV